MKGLFALLVAAAAMAALPQGAKAGSVSSLADWCVNVNGDTNTACNGGTGGTGGLGLGGTAADLQSTISLAGFHTTLEPGVNTLGTITIALGPGANQFVSFYADYDVSYSLYGSFDDFASTSGALPAGLSFSVNDPNVSSITSSPTGFVLFDQFANNTLDGMNWVATPSGPPTNCCDVVFALSLGNINVAAGDSATATFVVSDPAPASGFYIQQTNQDTNASIYLQGNVSGLGPTPAVPEPSTFGMVLLTGSFLVAWKRFRAAR
jgi:hypothetical protein